MNRRSAIRSFILVSAGASLLPSCLQKDNSSAKVVLNNIHVSGNQENILAALAENILPTTASSPGASGLSSHAYVLMMVDDCFKKEDQEKFMQGFLQFEETAKKKNRK
jgi:hypothetical protein